MAAPIHARALPGPRRSGGVALAALLLAACSEDEEPVWKQFNADDDRVTLEIGVDTVLDAVSTTLRSSGGMSEVGTAQADPGGGPIGTEHTFFVVVSADYDDRVGRATVRVESPGRGSDEYEMEPETGGEGNWILLLASRGDDGEVRTDTATFRLWYDVSGEEAGDDTGG